MKGTLLLNYDEDTKKIEEEEKMKFLRNLLENMGVPVDEFWTSSEPFTINQKIQLRSVLETFGVKVIDSLDGHLQVYVEDELVGEWHKCTYGIKRDLRQLDPRKQFYLEMYINYTSMFETDPGTT